MTSPHASIVFDSRPHGVEGETALGDVMILNEAGTAYVVATTAARAGRRAHAVAISTWGGSGLGNVELQQTGILDTDITDLEATEETRLVRVSSAGRIERIDSYTAGDDVIGYADIDGRVHLHFGIPWGEIASTPGLPDKSVQWNNAGGLAGETYWTREAAGRLNVTTSGFITYGAVGGTYSSTGLVRVAAQSGEGETRVIVGSNGGENWPVLKIAEDDVTFGDADHGSTWLRGESGVSVICADGDVDISANTTTGNATTEAASIYNYAYAAAGTYTAAARNDVTIAANCGVGLATPMYAVRSALVSSVNTLHLGWHSSGGAAGQFPVVSIRSNVRCEMAVGTYLSPSTGLYGFDNANGAGQVATRNLAFMREDTYQALAANPWGSGHGVFFFAATTTKSSSNPAAGIHLMVDSTTLALEYRTPTGTTHILSAPLALLTTTDATVTDLDTLVIATDTAVLVDWLVIAIKNDGAEGAAYVVRAAFRNDGGTVAQIGTTSVTVIGEDDAAWDITADCPVTTIRLRATGKAATPAKWKSRRTDVQVAA